MRTLVETVLSTASSGSRQTIYNFFHNNADGSEVFYSDHASLYDIVNKFKVFSKNIKNKAQNQLDNSSKLVLEAIRAAWLKEINLKLCPRNDNIFEENSGCLTKFGKKVVGPLARIVCLLTFLGGVTKYVCDTADSFASTILPTLGGGVVPVFVLIGLAAVFVSLALAVYIAFDFSLIREKMGIKSIRKHRIDELAEQKQQLLLIKQSLLTRLCMSKDDEVKKMAQVLIPSLIELHKKLKTEQQEYRQKLADPKLKITKYILNGLLSFMYAANGFFICQTGLPLIISALNYLIPALAITAPIPGVMLAIAILGATAAFIAFWCMEGQALGNFISNSRLFGYADVEKVNVLYTEDNDRDVKELDSLLESLNNTEDNPRDEKERNHMLESLNKISKADASVGTTDETLPKQSSLTA